MKYFSVIMMVGLMFNCTSNSPNDTQNKKRFFSDDSFWNQAIENDPEIDPNSDRWITMLKNDPNGYAVGINAFEWTIPVYEVDSTTPTYKVGLHRLTEEEKRAWNTVRDNDFYGHGPDFGENVPIPRNAEPDPEMDAHLAIVDRSKNLVWDMWGLKKHPNGSFTSKTGMVYPLNGDGTFDPATLNLVDNESVHFHGPSRAPGVPAIAGLIMYDEVMSGKIEHKLAMACRYSALKQFTYPAIWCDGFTEGGIPQGATLQLNPDLDLNQFELTREEKIVGKAMQEYGMVIVDFGGGNPVYAEGLWSHPGKSWEGKLRRWGKGLSLIPYDHYRILKIDKIINKGDPHKLYEEEHIKMLEEMF